MYHPMEPLRLTMLPEYACSSLASRVPRLPAKVTYRPPPCPYRRPFGNGQILAPYQRLRNGNECSPAATKDAIVGSQQ